ncbi:class I SAM-dependent methyltransferase [Actinomadura parmotrematis]|uniref:Class I SAM-dependent methyltransferase n=1 Tax=Actinomadura parmotrematis TaxID=2864039 RepID=A0ABS7G4K0_9ACTN|nr:class I SAM-dependent methyltransferase [Actinomadura parmotrematis]MBW8487649.1 class I SAM-dependent methyltransferase [Actinomadura parmotrematis]
MDGSDYRAVNRPMWDERVPVHVAGEFYDVAGFLAGRPELRDFEVAEVGDVTGRSLAHLQCHIGLDTLDWARRGARVAGLDFSAPAIDAARGIAAEAGIDARFVTADVYDAPAALGARYDIVYTGLGALNWLPDLDRWAAVVASLLEPGGFLHLSEFHPVGDVLDDATGTTVAYDYFDRSPQEWDEDGTYADLGASFAHTRSVEFRHGVGDVVSAVAAAGLRVEFLHEHDHTLFPRFAALERDGRVYRQPAGRPRVPLMYSLRASRPRV